MRGKGFQGILGGRQEEEEEEEEGSFARNGTGGKTEARSGEHNEPDGNGEQASEEVART